MLGSLILNVALAVIAVAAAMAPAWSPTVTQAQAESYGTPSSVTSETVGSVLTVAPTTTTTTSVSEEQLKLQLTGADSEFLRLTNLQRVSPLSWNDGLASYAQVHLARIMETGRLWHSPDAQLLAVGDEWMTVGENLGVGPSVTTIQEALLASPTHRENIELPDFDSFGSASEVGADGRLWTVHIYGARS